MMAFSLTLFWQLITATLFFSGHLFLKAHKILSWPWRAECCVSDISCISCEGDPQGSVLRPLLFSLFTHNTQLHHCHFVCSWHHHHRLHHRQRPACVLYWHKNPVIVVSGQPPPACFRKDKRADSGHTSQDRSASDYSGSTSVRWDFTRLLCAG